MNSHGKRPPTWDIQDLAMTVYRRFRQLARPPLAVVDKMGQGQFAYRALWLWLQRFCLYLYTIAIDDMEYYIQGT